jgi:carboxypeptidase Taq
MESDRAYAELLSLSREHAILSSVGALLEWDEETMMPSGGVEHRSRQRAMIAGLEHQLLSGPRLGHLLDVIEASEMIRDPRSPAAVNTRELRRIQRRHARLDRGLIEELARTTTVAQHAFVEARNASDLSLVAHHLDDVVRLKRKEAALLAEGTELYDALLDEYEPNARAGVLHPLFESLAADLASLRASLPTQSRAPRIERRMPIDAQRVLTDLLLDTLGFDRARGRIDVADHPFTEHIGPGDTRITTRYVESDFADGFLGALHELGHGLYDQGLDLDQYGTPLGESASLGIHESQARLFENQVGRSRAFWRFFYPRAQRLAAGALDGVTLDEFLRSLNRVAPSPIRVRADPLTYDLHILIRFDLERALISGDLSVKDLPAAWNDAYRDRLGLCPLNDREGCLQDGHWSAGMFGYFPTYTLGNLIAAQLFLCAERDLGGFDRAFEAGDFSGLVSWLRAKIHRMGKTLAPAALVAEATGGPLEAAALVRSLRALYA